MDGLGVQRPSPRTLVAGGVAGGVAGSALVTVASYWVGATPLAFRTDPPAVVEALPQGSPVALVGWYVGVGLVVLAWLGLGRHLWRGTDVDVRVLRAFGLATAAPLLLAMPAMSRDLWAYAAQARITASGLDPYTVAPSAFGGPTLANVSARWVDAPSPYGPLWTVLARGLDAVTGDHELLQVVVLRLPAVLGFVLLAAVVPVLARRVGASARTATWLVVANPLVVLHGVGGGHNDTLMVGLLAAGLLVAVSSGSRVRALLLGGVLVGLAAAIKIPAVVAAPFLPLLWARYAPDGPHRGAASWRVVPRERAADALGGAALALLGALAALGLSTLAAGRGLAWLTAANTDEHGGGPVVTAVLAAVLVVLWVLAVRDAPLPLLAAALLAPALISTLSLAWYWFWPLVPAALAVRGRLAAYLLAVGSITAILHVRPNGLDLALRPELLVVLAAVVAWLTLDRRWRPFAGAVEPEAVADPAVSRSSKT
ncbi:polyprenol phosphomannose-dependent alpha 1,6 mannosyltransferase MptB [Jatrophihabitans sp. YIM 134969]